MFDCLFCSRRLIDACYRRVGTITYLDEITGHQPSLSGHQLSGIKTIIIRLTEYVDELSRIQSQLVFRVVIGRHGGGVVGVEDKGDC